MLKLKDYLDDRHSGESEKYRCNKFDDQSSNNCVRRPTFTRGVQIDVSEQYWKYNNIQEQ